MNCIYNGEYVIVSPVRMYSGGGGGGGDTGLVIVTPPRPQTFLCECDNFKNPEWIASIFHM